MGWQTCNTLLKSSAYNDVLVVVLLLLFLLLDPSNFGFRHLIYIFCMYCGCSDKLGCQDETFFHGLSSK